MKTFYKHYKSFAKFNFTQSTYSFK